MVEAKKTRFTVALSLLHRNFLFTEITKIFLTISIGAWESRYNSENILERMAAIEGKLEKLQEQYLQKEQRIYSLEAINIELKLQLNLKANHFKKQRSLSSFLFTVFPRIVSAETILFWKLKCGNYSREETINLLLFL